MTTVSLCSSHLFNGGPELALKFSVQQEAAYSLQYKKLR